MPGGKSETVDISKTVGRITEFIQGKKREADASVLVLGLSGGIDSAVTSALCVEAVGAENVHGMVMPAGSTRDENTEDAKEHAESLGIEYEVVDIQPVVEEFQEVLPDAGGKEAVGNLRARSRMVLEYYRANSDRGLVVGTGNRSEVLLGYYTKYGDGGVDILPIGELYKTEVRDVARYLNVSERIIEKPPTAGLWEGQTDEEELGASYETIDRVLQYLVDEGMSVEGVAEKTSVDVSKVEDLKRTYESSEHKRKMPPSPDLR